MPSQIVDGVVRRYDQVDTEERPDTMFGYVIADLNELAVMSEPDAECGLASRARIFSSGGGRASARRWRSCAASRSRTTSDCRAAARAVESASLVPSRSACDLPSRAAARAVESAFLVPSRSACDEFRRFSACLRVFSARRSAELDTAACSSPSVCDELGGARSSRVPGGRRTAGVTKSRSSGCIASAARAKSLRCT